MILTPVAYIIFNRPRHTRTTFAAIREQQPARLFIIADGPRSDQHTDFERCQEVRQIVEQIDWPCEVQRNYSEQNLGCKQRVISGLNWVFELVDKAIIIEDDVLPHADFYGYCETMIERYKDDERVMLITGCNFQDGRRRGNASYYFSKYNHVWGWATWRRAWQRNDPILSFWPEWKSAAKWIRHSPDTIERRYWERIFDQMYLNEIDTWDYSWTASVWHHGGLTVTPNVNLVTNIGFGPDGTHTVANEDQDGFPLHPLGPLTHPMNIKQDRKADRYVFDYVFGGREQRLRRRILKFIRLVVGALVQRFKRYI